MSSSADSNSNAESLPSSQMNTNPNLGIEVELPDIELTTEDAKKFFNAPPPPNSVMEALEQRLAKFKSTLEQANQENNASKVRRLNRIVKQYENTIKDVKRGKTVDFDELPTPPGLQINNLFLVLNFFFFFLIRFCADSCPQCGQTGDFSTKSRSN